MLPAGLQLWKFCRWSFAALVCWSLLAATLEAQVTGRSPELTPSGFPTRGPGFYISLVKLFFFVVIFWAWIYSTAWVSRDAQTLKLEWEKWNGIVFGVGILGFIGFVAIPIFWVSLPLLLLAYGVPLGIYIYQRNQTVDPHEQVMTPDHLRFVIATQLRKVGIKMAAAKKDPEPIKFVPKGAADSQADQVNLLTARRSEAFQTCQELVFDALCNQGAKLHATSILFELTRSGASTRLLVNGLWETGPSYDAATGQGIVGVFLQLANLNPQDFRNRQTGKLEIRRGKKKYKSTITCQGTQNGARAILEMDDGLVKLETPEEIGINPHLLQHLKKVLANKEGVFVVATPPGHGLSTSLKGAAIAADRYTRSFVAVDDAANPEPPIENVPVTTYNSVAGETPLTVLPKLVRQYPDVYVVHHIPDADTLEFLLGPDVAGEDHLVITGVRAKESAEAPLRVLSVKNAEGKRVPPPEFAKALLGVLSSRLVRKLCPDCKEAFEPDEQTLRRLGLSPEVVKQLYRPPVPDPQKKQKPCPSCNGRGYIGRTAIFELVEVTDPVRQVLASKPNLELLRDAMRKSGMRTIQQDGIRLVALGETSLEEVTRVMKE